MALAPRHVATVGLLALVPVVAFAVGRPDGLAATIAATNVLLITASLAVAMRPVARRGDGH